MKHVSILLGTAALGIVVGALIVLFLARSASEMYVENENLTHLEMMFGRAVDYEREGDLQKAYALYFSVVNWLDQGDSNKAEKWSMLYPLAYPIFAKMKESSDPNGKGTRNINAMRRAAFGHLLEKMGRSDDAYAQYSIAAKSVGVDVERIKKVGESVVRIR